MIWSNLHARLLSDACELILGKSEAGAMAFVRCLTADVVKSLAEDVLFAPDGWHVWRVADLDDRDSRTISADNAVELRETKTDATLLLVDTVQAGAGMDGIYSAAREIDEASLFDQARRLAAREITRCLSRQVREYAERAIKKARGFGQRFSVSPWTEFDFLVRAALGKNHPGEQLYLLGLWPVQTREDSPQDGELNLARLFVERLLGTDASGLTPAQRIDALRLLDPSEEQISDLQVFLRSAATKPLFVALADLAGKEHLWINAVQVEDAAGVIQSIEIAPWRTRTGKVAKWSGLVEEGDADEPPTLILNPDADKTGDYSKIEIRWTARPDRLEKGVADYHIVIVTDMDEELVSQGISHSGKKEEKCRFTNDDFSMLSEDAVISAKIVVSVVGNEGVEPQESEEFFIRFGQPLEREPGGVGKKVRTFAEGVIELDDRDVVATLASSADRFPIDSKGFVLCRTRERGKSYRVFRPPLIREVEEQWTDRAGEVGRWRVRVRSSGARAAAAEFVPFAALETGTSGTGKDLWSRTVNASRRMAERLTACGGGVGQIYDEKSKALETVVKEYLLSWAALLEEGDPSLALANTVEIQSLSGRLVGLIVLPSHPLRVAWHVAYDNLVLHAVFEQGLAPKDVREELKVLDGAMFPALLPGLEGDYSFVFADTLGFHTVGMVPDYDKEPKAAVAILTRALGESDTADMVPTVGRQSAEILGTEILKYIECHNTPRLLHIHALRAGDGLTMARALGRVQEWYRRAGVDKDGEDEEPAAAPAFVLEFYPSQQQRGVAGRFIAEAREKRRSGAGVVAAEDQWMLESISLRGGMNLPRLRWARKREQDPASAAHLAVAFDTFESQVETEPEKERSKTRPLFVFGLLSFFERQYTSIPSPLWQSIMPIAGEGEKHPSDRTHTERLVRLQHTVLRCVARALGTNGDWPTLRTAISLEKAHSLHQLHQLSDWVITLDRNAGIEYFDSPNADKDIYDAYVIDCVPEREDLGCLQLITSTANLEEVRNLLDAALDQMGLSRSRRNAEFLMEQLKALSGRLAIRLTGQRAPTSELIALSMCHANCSYAPDSEESWVSLQTGFLIPVDDIRDMLPPLSACEKEEGEKEGAVRPDLIYVSIVPRKGLSFQFIEVKYRRHLRVARSPEVLEAIARQVDTLHRRWHEWYGGEGVSSIFRAVRRAKLARVLRFYADKAHRHYLPDESYRATIGEIERMIEKGAEYSFAAMDRSNRGWVFCPEYAGADAMEITPAGWETRVFLFGPGRLPDSGVLEQSIRPLSGDAAALPAILSTEQTSQLPLSEDKTQSNKGGKAESPETEELAKPFGEESGSAPLAVCLGTDAITGDDVSWSLTVKGNPHLLIAGLPGMGKTTCLLNLCTQMLDANIRPIVFSYHQDIDERLESAVNAVRFVDFHGLAFNPLQVINRTSSKAYLDVAGALRDIFVAIFPEIGDLQGESIRKAIKDSFLENGWDDPNADLDQLVEPPFARFVEILVATPKPDRGLRALLARMEELSDYGFFKVAETQGSLWESELPTVIRIHETQNDNLQKAFASLVFYGLYKDMFRRGLSDHITHALVFDEAHRAARLRLIPTMAKECRKYGISLILASQEAKDFNVSLFSAVANYLVLRLTETDAKALVRNVASSDQERVLIDKIKQMGRFKGLYFSEERKNPSLVSLRE